MAKMNTCFWLAQMGLFASLPAMADITLVTLDQSTRIGGELVGFENNQYTIKTAIGELVVDAGKVTCVGADCPELGEPLNQQVRVASAPAFASSLVLSFMEELAVQTDASFALTQQRGSTLSGQISGEDGSIYGDIEVGSGGTSAAFDQLLSGDVEIVFTERRATNAEVERFIEAGLGNLYDAANETIFAQDGLVAVVSPDNPVKAITVDQAEAIFSGQLNNWSQLGGANLPIEAYIPSDGSELADYFTRAVLDRNFATLSSDVNRTAGASEVDTLVSTQPGAIALMSSVNTVSARSLRVASSCGIISEPGTFAIRSEDYPFSRRMYAYTTNRTSPPLLTRLKDVMQSAKGQSIVDKAGFVSLDSETTTLNNFGNQLAYSLAAPEQTIELGNMQQFTREVLNSERLSTTFRFATGSSEIDNKARADAIRLAELLARPSYEGAEMILVGFTDSIGRSELNKVLSGRRAAQIREEILVASNGQIDPSAITTLGFGAAFPVGCNSDEAGRQTNRRVEIWLR